MRLAGRRALITGASMGFGLAVARRFVEEGASVMLCARDGKQLEKASSSLARDGVRVLARVADVSREAEVENLVRATLEGLGGLEILVCNARVYGPKGALGSVPAAEWWRAVEINLLGTYLCCRAVAPHFRERKYGKIVLLSGGGATKPLPFLSAYAASKAGVARLGDTLAEELRDFKVDVNSVAPGALNTRLLEEVLAAGPENVGQAFYRQSVEQKERGGTPLERGAALCAYLASSESDGITGKLISAVWDPWEDLAKHREDLSTSDIYTLRRIVPKDRGKAWGDK